MRCMDDRPPDWIYFVSPLASILAVFLAYLLGNAQGRAQTRYDRATDALGRILALAIEAEDYLETLRSFGPGGPVEEWTEAVSRTVRKVEDGYRSSRPWLVPHQRQRVEAVLAPFRAAEALMVSARDMGETLGASVDPVSHAEALRTFDVGTPIERLDDEVTRLASAPSVPGRVWNLFLDSLARLPRPKGRDAAMVGADVTAEQLVVYLDDGREIRTPLAWYPRLLNASPEERRRWELLGEGGAISWPGLDEDLSLAGMLAGVPAPGFRPG